MASANSDIYVVNMKDKLPDPCQCTWQLIIQSRKIPKKLKTFLIVSNELKQA